MESRNNLKLGNLGDGIYLVDSCYMGLTDYTACYILEDREEIAIIETNTNSAVAKILQGISQLGWSKDQVKYVIVTHIHLDHAGGAGLLIKSLPNADLLVHPRGYKHMVHPEKLIASAKYVYGDQQYKRLYGDIIPVPESRARAVADGEKVTVGVRELVFYDTPGHARHHHIIHDSQSGSIFSGDAFGLAYPRFQFGSKRLVFPSTSPTQFEPEMAIESFRRIVDLNPDRVLFTHFGEVKDIDSCFSQVTSWIEFSVEIASRRYREGLSGEGLIRELEQDIWAYFEKLIHPFRPKGLASTDRDFLKLDAAINAQGLAHYLAFLDRNR